MKDTKAKLKQGYVWAYMTPQHSDNFTGTPNGFRAVVYDFAQSVAMTIPMPFYTALQANLSVMTITATNSSLTSKV